MPRTVKTIPAISAVPITAKIIVAKDLPRLSKRCITLTKFTMQRISTASDTSPKIYAICGLITTSRTCTASSATLIDWNRTITVRLSSTVPCPPIMRPT